MRQRFGQSKIFRESIRTLDICKMLCYFYCMFMSCIGKRINISQISSLFSHAVEVMMQEAQPGVCIQALLVLLTSIEA
jgi:hypothetical protein